MVVTLTFRAPSNTGSSAITSYRATCRSSTPQITATATTSPMLIVGLINGVTYTCSLAAINSAGASSESEPVTVTPVGPTLSVSAR
jgi:titin